MQFLQKRKVPLGLIFALLFVSFNTLFSFQSLNLVVDHTTRVSHTHEALAELQALFSTVQDIETGQRGYVITGEEIYLEPYTTALARLNNHFENLRYFSLSRVNAQQLDALQDQVESRAEMCRRIVALRREGDIRGAQRAVEMGEGKRRMDEIRRTIGQMQAVENSELRRRDSEAAFSAHRARLTLAFAFLANISLLGMVYYMIVRDVAHRQKSEAELRKSQATFQTLANSIPQLAWMADQSGYLFWYNQQWYNYTGTTFEDMQGWGWEKVHDPEHLGHVVDSWKKSLRSGQPWQDTFPIKGKNGEFRWFLSRAHPVIDEKTGRVLRWCGTNTDITDEREREADLLRVAGALMESEARKSSILETALDCVVGMDHEHRIIEWNPAAEKTFGYSREEAVGQSLPELIIPPALRNAHYKGMKRYLETGEGRVLDQRIEVAALRRDGTEFPIELAVTRIVGEGTPLFTAYLRDITARKQSEIDLQRAKNAAETASKTKSLFLANMSHELRTPLNAILGYSEMLQEDARENDLNAFAPDLEKINTAGKHLLALINDILDLSKIEAGKMELYLEEFDVGTVVNDLLETLRPLLEKNANTLHVECDPDLGEMRADLTKVRQSLLNLLSNAAKFTHHGAITLSARRERMNDKDWIVLGVRDTGIGMSAEQLVKLFRPFTQADPSTTRKFGGTGLGLALTRRFCQMMGGDVMVASEPGKGSTFTLKIPASVGAPGDVKQEVALSEADALTQDGDLDGESGLDGIAVSTFENLPAADNFEVQAVAPSIPGVTILPSETEKVQNGENPEVAFPAPETSILVIDDDPTQRELVRRFLSHQGFDVVTATGGEDGLQVARRLRPLAITLDVMMPDMDGWSVLEAMKRDPLLQDIPVIMLTMVDDKNKGYALGAADYLTKPVDRARLSRVLRKYRCPHPPCPVLIIEDDDTVRAMLSKMLESAGWTVSEATNGREALTVIEANRPALILLDLMMPEMDGFEFVAQLRHHREWKNIPAVVLTAKELTAEDRLRLNGYVQKVVQKGGHSREELLQQVSDLITSCTGEKELTKENQ